MDTDQPVTRHQTNCRACPAGCGIQVDTQGDRVLRIAGDRGHPLSHGYLCVKGKRLPWLHHREDRLDVPAIGSQETTWSTCLDDLSGRLASILTTAGPDGVGVYRASGVGLDTLGQRASEAFLDRIGSRQRYSPLTVDHAPALRAAELVAGSAEVMPTWVPEDEQSRLVLFVGCNPVLSHGYLTILPDPLRRIRAFQRRGGRVWVADPRRTQTAAIADGHLSVRPGSDAVLLAWLARESLDAASETGDLARMTSSADRSVLRRALRPFDRATVATVTGAPRSELEGLLGDIERAGRVAVVTGTGVTFGPHALVTEWLRWVLLIATGSVDAPGGMYCSPGWLSQLEHSLRDQTVLPEGSAGPGPPSRPELPSILGQRPCVALADEIESGALRALIVAGGSPLTAFPDPTRGQAALRSLDVLAVIDVVRTPLTEMATHVLPAASQLERADVVAFNGRTAMARAVLRPAALRRPLWRMFADLGARLGFEIFPGIDVAEATDEALLRQLLSSGRDGADALFAAGSHGLSPPRRYGWLCEGVLPAGRWRLAPPVLVARLPALLLDDAGVDGRLLLSSRRQTARLNSTSYSERERPLALLHPGDAASLAIKDGDEIDIASAHGQVRARAALDDRVRPGVISLPHGWAEVNVAHLTSSTAAIDPLTGEPQMTAIPVRVTAAGDGSRDQTIADGGAGPGHALTGPHGPGSQATAS